MANSQMRRNSARVKIEGMDRALTVFGGIVYTIPSLLILVISSFSLWRTIEQGRLDNLLGFAVLLIIVLVGAWACVVTVRYTYRAIRGYVVIGALVARPAFIDKIYEFFSSLVHGVGKGVSALEALVKKVLVGLLILLLVALVIGGLIFGVRWLFTIPSWAAMIIVLLVLILLAVNKSK